MRFNRTVWTLGTVMMICFVAGCQQVPGYNEPIEQGKQSQSSQRRFDSSDALDSTSARQLSQKYAELSETVTALRQANQILTEENERLEQVIATLEQKLKQSEAELTEANSLLVETMVDLNEWKANILGFRNEMREAEKAQLEALLKILEAVGGKVETSDSTDQITEPSSEEQE